MPCEVLACPIFAPVKTFHPAAGGFSLCGTSCSHVGVAHPCVPSSPSLKIILILCSTSHLQSCHRRGLVHVSVDYWQYLVRLWRSINGCLVPCPQRGQAMSLVNTLPTCHLCPPCLCYVCFNVPRLQGDVPPSFTDSFVLGGFSQLRIKALRGRWRTCPRCDQSLTRLSFLTEPSRCFPHVPSVSTRHDHQTGKADPWILPALTGIFSFFFPWVENKQNLNMFNVSLRSAELLSRAACRSSPPLLLITF